GARGAGDVHGGKCPVIQDDERICQGCGVGHPCLCGKREECFAHPLAVVRYCQLLGLACRRLGGGVDERAAPELRKCHVVGDRVEHREDLLLRIIDAGLCRIHALTPCVQAASKVRGDEFVLPAEYVVQRTL